METNKPIIYQEKVSGTKWGFYLSPIAILPLLVDYFNHSLSSKTYLTAGLFLFIFISIGALMKLEWFFNSTTFSYKMRPFHFKWQQIPLNEIQKIEVLKINPLLEFGGWGLRFGKLGKAYTIEGKLILHIELKSGKKLNFTVKNKIATDIAIQNLRITSN